MNKEQVEWALEVWKTTIGVQQHFNDIEMRIRNYALTLLVAVLAGAGVAIREKAEIPIGGTEISLGTVVLIAGLLAWLAFYFMDAAWYHRLLLGAVKHGMDVEAELKRQIPGIALTERIKDESPLWKGRKFEMHSPGKIRFFYLFIAVLLVLFAALVQLGVAGETGQESETPQHNSASPSIRPVGSPLAVAP